MIKCCKCGQETIWQNDFDAEDVSVFEETGDYTIVSYYYCCECDAMYEVWHSGNNFETMVVEVETLF